MNEHILEEKDVCRIIESLQNNAGKNEFSQETQSEFEFFREALPETIQHLQLCSLLTEDTENQEFLKKCEQLQMMLNIWSALSQPKKALMTESEWLQIGPSATTAEVLSESYSIFFNSNFDFNACKIDPFVFFLELQDQGLAIHFEDQKACSFIKNWLLYFGFSIAVPVYNDPQADEFPSFTIPHAEINRFLSLFNPVRASVSAQRLYQQAGRDDLKSGALLPEQLIKLPKETLSLVFSFLWHDDIFSLAAVNKSMRSFVITQNLFFRQKLKTYYPDQKRSYSKVRDLTYFGQFLKHHNDEYRDISLADRELFFGVKTNRFNVKQKLAGLEDNTLLHVMAEKGAVKFVELLIEKGADVNVKNSNGDTPLHLAAKNGHTNCVVLLHKRGSNCVAKNSNGDTPFHLAAKNGHIGGVIYFTTPLLPVDKNNDYFSPLTLAIQHGHIEAVKTIINATESRVRMKCPYFQHELHQGLFPRNPGTPEQQQMRYGVLEYLLKEKIINLSPVDEWSKRVSLCVLAADRNDLQALQLLLAHGVDVNAEDQFKETALHIAVKQGNVGLVKFLIEQGANVYSGISYRNDQVKTPFFLAKENYDRFKAAVVNPGDRNDVISAAFLEIMTLLKSKGPLIPPEHITQAIMYGHLNELQLKDFENYGADITTDLLHVAILSNPSLENRAPIIRYLIQHPDVNINAIHHLAPLHTAITCDDFATIQLLVEKGANVKAVTVDGKSSLHFAIEKQNLAVIRYLVEKGASLTAVNNDGVTPLQLAKRTYYTLALHDPLKKSLRDIIRYLDNVSPVINANPQPVNLPSYWNAYWTAVKQSLEAWPSWLSVSNFVDFSVLLLFIGISVAATVGMSELLATITIMTASISLAIGALAFVPFAAWKMYEHYNEWRFEQREDACRSWVEKGNGEWRKHTQHGSVFAQDLKNRYEKLSHDDYLETLKKNFDGKKEYSYWSYLRDLPYQLLEWSVKNPWLFLFAILAVGLSIFIGADFLHSGLAGVFGNILTTICHYLGPLLTQSIGMLTPEITHIVGAVLLTISPLIILDIVTRVSLTHQNNKIVAQALSTLPDLHDTPGSSLEIYSPDLSARTAAAQFWSPASEKAHRQLAVPVIVTEAVNAHRA